MSNDSTSSSAKSGSLPLPEGIEPPGGPSMTLANAAANFKPRIEGYEIEELIGQGGMATVWRAVQHSTRRTCALKLLGASAATDRLRARFEREIQIAARLEHPNIARVYDSGTHGGLSYYAMELVIGEPLDGYVESRGLPRRQILELMRTVARIVQYAHQRGVIHRDLKFSNVMVSPDGQPHLLDFGLARAVADEDGTRLTLDGQLAGTPAFMSPEQASGRSDVLDTRTDVYSLGVMLYRLLTRNWPHDLSGPNHEIMIRIQQNDAFAPRSFDRTIDRDLEALLLKCLSRNVEDRYASAGELASEIDNYLAGEPLAAHRKSTIYFLRKRLRKHLRPLMIVLTLALLAVAAALAAFPVAVAAAGLLILSAVSVLAFIEIRRQRDRALVQHNRMHGLLRIVEAMNREQDLPSLLDLILTEARALSSAEAGSLFLRRGNELEFVIAQNDKLTPLMGRLNLEAAFKSTSVRVAKDSIAGYVASSGKPVNIPDVSRIGPRLPFVHNAEWDRRNNYRTQSVLAVPLKAPDGQVVGVLQLINRLDRAGHVVGFTEELQSLIESMATQAAISLRFHQLKSTAVV